MCIVCEQSKHLAILQQILLALEADNCDDLEVYQYVVRKYIELKAIIDREETMFQRVKETLGNLLSETETVFYPIIKDEKQAQKN